MLNNTFSMMFVFIAGIALFAVIILSIYMIIKNNKSKDNNNKSKAIEILNQKYALGEISEEEYIKKKEILRK
jgi:putative membrane protein